MKQIKPFKEKLIVKILNTLGFIIIIIGFLLSLYYLSINIDYAILFLLIIGIAVPGIIFTVTLELSNKNEYSRILINLLKTDLENCFETDKLVQLLHMSIVLSTDKNGRYKLSFPKEMQSVINTIEDRLITIDTVENR